MPDIGFIVGLFVMGFWLFISMAYTKNREDQTHWYYLLQTFFITLMIGALFQGLWEYIRSN